MASESDASSRTDENRMTRTIIEDARSRLGIPNQLDKLDDYRSVLDLFDASVRSYGDKPAFSSLGRTLSFRELDGLVARFAAFLQRQPELAPGDRIAIQLPNLIQYPVALFGAMRAGLVVVNTNPLYKPEELEHQLVDSGAKALLVLANFAHTAQKVLARTRVRCVIVAELADLHPPLRRFLINKGARYLKRMVPPYHLPGALSFRDALEGSSGDPQPVQHQPQELAVLQYTGGTTGVAKGAMLSHRNLIANTLQGEAMFTTYGIEEGAETFIVPLPLYHIYSFILSMIMFSSGNHCVLIPNPRDLKGLVADMRRTPFTGFCGLNTLFVALEQNAGFRQLDFSRLKVTISGGMALTSGAAKRWKEVTGSDIYEGYGLTETSPVVSVNPGSNNQLGTIGLPVPATEVKVVGDDGSELGIDQPGELCVRGPQVMLGYWQRQDATAEVLDDDGWLRTGDIAVIRDDGYLKIVDRKKDMIVVSGFKVFPGEVEEVISRHPQVKEAAVVGVSDEHSGEVVMAFVVRRDDALSEQALRDYCHEHLTGYKVPKRVEFREELPKSNVGKVLRRELRDEVSGAKAVT
jgi:long-chain acyl-CoA synthetase